MESPRRIFRLGRVTPGPAGVFGLVCALIGAAYTAKVVAFAFHNSCFVGDDVSSLWLASRMPPLEFFLSPIDVHFVPLHRATNWIMARVADLRFSFALVFLLAVHLATLVLLGVLLRRLQAGAVGWFLLGAYAVHVTLGSMFMWWSSGLHRLPYVFFSVLSCYAYLLYRETGSWRAALLLCVAMLGALGFYSKALLIPLYVGALHVALLGVQPMRIGRSGAAATAGALLMLAFAYLAVWKAHTAYVMQSITTDAAFYAGFVRWGLRVFGPTWLGIFLGDGAWVLPATVAAASFACGASIALNRRAALAWAALLAVLVANFLFHAASAAKTGYGFGTLMADRYYFESAFLVVVFAGAAFHGIARVQGPRALTTRVLRWGAPVVGASILGAIAMQSYRSFLRIVDVSYATHRVAHEYMTNLRTSLDALSAEEQRALTLKDGPMPPEIVSVGSILRRQSDLLRLMDVHVRYAKNARYYISSDGRIVRR
jgi:hypothetical protein